jgi:xylono-1,5-lactonase
MERLATGYGLIEGPVWDPGRGLLFSDVLNGGVYCLARSGTITTVVEHRRGIGGMALHSDGGLVVSGRNVAYKPPDGGATAVVLDRDESIVGFNDLTTDAAGRVYVGSLAASPLNAAGRESTETGWLHVIDVDGSSRRVSDGVLLTNGLGFSPDGTRLYHCDSRAGIVRVYDVSRDGGVGPQRVFARTDVGLPDGLAVSVDGAVWVAIAHGSAVIVFDEDGKERERIPCSLPMVTSVCFGGDDLTDVYIVTGSAGSGREDAGSIFRMRAGVAGLAVPPARVAVPR